MATTALINGQAVDNEWFKERGFQFGDGLFETIAVFDGAPCLLNRHFARLAKGCDVLGLPHPDFDQLTEEIYQLCNQVTQGVLKLFWTAGESERGYSRPKALSPKRILKVSQWPDFAHLDTSSVSIRRCKLKLSQQPVLSGLKHLNRLEQVIARNEWSDSSIAEGLMFDLKGNLVEGTMSNVFVQHNGSLSTPTLELSGVAGVVRDLAIDIGKEQGHELAVQQISNEDLSSAEAIYLTNSIIGVWRVGQLDKQIFDTTVAEHGLMSAVRQAVYQA